MNRIGTAVGALAFAVLLAAPARVVNAAPPPSLVTLKNGLRVVLAPDSGAAAVDVAVWYPVGIGAEGPGMEGVRRMAERLMFRGSANVPDGEHARRIAVEGGTAGTSLQPDWDCVYETIPAEALDLALSLEADRMAALAPSAAAFEDVRRVGIAEARSRDARPVVQRGLQHLGAGVYEGLSYAHPLEGDEASIGRMTPERVNAWRASHEGPGNAVLVIVGRFDPVATLARVRSRFERLPRGSAKPEASAGMAAAPPAGHRDTERSALQAPVLFVGWRVPGMNDPDAPAIEMLANVLGLGDDSRFAHTMKTTWGTVSFAQCGLDRHLEAAMLWTVVAPNPAADTSAIERQVVDAVGALARDPLAAPELERVRAQVLTAERVRLQSVRARGQALGEAVMVAGDPAAAAQRLAAFERLTAADLQRVAARILGGEHSTLWMLPSGGAR